MFDKVKIAFYKTALHIACENENIEIIEMLLKDPFIDINLFMEILFII